MVVPLAGLNHFVFLLKQDKCSCKIDVQIYAVHQYIYGIKMQPFFFSSIIWIVVS